MDAARTQPALGQLLIERGVLTPAQFERVLAVHEDNDKPLSDIIVEHGLAERHVIEAALSDHSVSQEDQLLGREERIAQLLQEVEALQTSRKLAERNLTEREETLTRLQTANEAQLKNLADVRDSLAAALAERAQRDDQLRSSESTRAAIAEELERTNARVQTAEQNLAEREEMLAK